MGDTHDRRVRDILCPRRAYTTTAFEAFRQEVQYGKNAANQSKIFVSLLVLHVLLALCLLVSIVSFGFASILIIGLVTVGCGLLLSRISRDSHAARHIIKSRGGKVYLYCMRGIVACAVLVLVVPNYLGIFTHHR